MNLTACGGMFFDRMNRINKIFYIILYPESATNLDGSILSKKRKFKLWLSSLNVY